MTDDAIMILLSEIQKAIDNKSLATALKFYHPDIIYIGPAFPEPVLGLDALEKAFGRNFQGIQKTKVNFSNVNIHRLSGDSFVVYCQIEGTQSIHFSSRNFKGWLTRVFVDAGTSARIIHEHFSLR